MDTHTHTHTHTDIHTQAHATHGFQAIRLEQYFEVERVSVLAIYKTLWIWRAGAPQASFLFGD